MHALLSIVLALIGLAIQPAPVASHEPLELVVQTCDDCLDFFLLLADPDVQTQILHVEDLGDVTVVAAVHSTAGEDGEELAWAALYTFPSTIYAHSIVTVPFHADEMD